MVRPESCIELAGASPVAVSAEAPCSRPRARQEIASPEWGVKSPWSVIWPVGGKQVRRPSIKRTLQPRDIGTRKGVVVEPLMSRPRQQTAPVNRFGAVQDRRGVWRRACGDSSLRNRRDPSRLLTSSEGDPYKPTVKEDCAGRESEGFVVLMTPVSKDRSREGTLLWSWRREEVSVRAWSQDPTTPWTGQNPAPSTARAGSPVSKRDNSVDACILRPSANRGVACACNESAGMTSGGVRKVNHYSEACMFRMKTIGKPYAGNPHVRFEWGPQETELTGHRA
jgi:hypothetical protein